MVDRDPTVTPPCRAIGCLLQVATAWEDEVARAAAAKSQAALLNEASGMAGRPSISIMSNRASHARIEPATQVWDDVGAV